ncbi:MAG: DUF5005 domain-containing protein [Bryobacteraceae bacterium]
MLNLSIATVALAGMSCATLSAQTCHLPPVPGQGTPDSTFDSLVTQNGPGWTGGDGTYSLLLPDGSDLWMWSDSYIGTVDPQTRRRAGWLFTAHNSLTRSTPGSNTITTLGYPPQTTSYFVPSNPNNWFWQGGGIVVQTAPGVYQVLVTLLEWTGVFSFQGNSVATLSWPALTTTSVVPIALPDLSLEWGSQLLQLGNFLYIYGIKDPGTWQKLPYAARMASYSDLTNPATWQYWNAASKSWVSGQTNATPMAGVPAITNEYSVTRYKTVSGTFYLLTGMETWSPAYPNWKNVVTYYSCSPVGPWSNRTIVYVTPESGAPGCSVGKLYAYNPKDHPEFANSSGVLVSYNVNAATGQDLVCANDYMPRFIRVPISGLIN